MKQSNIFEYLEDLKENKLIICKDNNQAKNISYIAEFLKIPMATLPDIRVFRGEDLRPYREEIQEFFSQLQKFYTTNSNKILISPIRTLLLPFPKKDDFDSFKINFADTLNIEELKNRLYGWGYILSDIVSVKGEVSFRGDIIDIFPINSKTPFRIVLFDNEVETISSYDETTQKSSKDELETIEIIPAFLSLKSDEYEELKKSVQNSKYDTFVKDIDSLGLWHLNRDKIDLSGVWVESLKEEIEDLTSIFNKEFKELIYPQIKEGKKYQDIEKPKINNLLEAHKSKKIVVIAKNEAIVRGSELKSFKNIEFCYQNGIINIIGKDKLIVSINKKEDIKRVKKPTILLDTLKVGDYVVHENYGVALFKGIEKREILGAISEFVILAYQNEDTLLIPVSNLETIDRYIADGGSLPIMDKLGKANLKRLKEKVKEKLFAIANELIEKSAKRHLEKGIIIKETIEYPIFASKSGFQYTQDQQKAIDEIKEEMASNKIMDRLLSGDVGFGKTEVAMHALFLVAKENYQAMMIAPTTLLSSQHYKTLKERFLEFNIKLAKLDRFTKAKEKKEIILALENKEIDIVVGTHALLNLKFKNLALVIIDEEHKFGVKQKEKLKEISLNIHLLSMSATPIPRSLNLALSKVKTFSEILTPPKERFPVRTFVKSYNEALIKESILRELRRGGQIFYLFNSIGGIEDKKEQILEILPKLRILVLHSKVPPKTTEEEMLRFEQGKYDLLLSTSIIESGIHIPKANTMIVEGANNFGMADLHQLRGRVGRGKKEGFCYFLVTNKEDLSQNAQKRLLALEQHSALGSGAILAFHDLEIRGGGNIIGEAQSGHIKQIGYSLYLKMLEENIKKLSKEEDIKKEVEIKLQINGYINEELIKEDRIRLDLYRRLSLCHEKFEVYEIEEEIADRFGKLDQITRQFIDIIIIKILAKKRNISKISSSQERIFIEKNEKREQIKAPTRDDDDIIITVKKYLEQ